MSVRYSTNKSYLKSFCKSWFKNSANFRTQSFEKTQFGLIKQNCLNYIWRIMGQIWIWLLILKCSYIKRKIHYIIVKNMLYLQSDMNEKDEVEQNYLYDIEIFQNLVCQPDITKLINCSWNKQTLWEKICILMPTKHRSEITPTHNSLL